MEMLASRRPDAREISIISLFDGNLKTDLFFFAKIQVFRDTRIDRASRGQHLQALYVEMLLVVVSKRPVLEFDSRNDDYHIFDNNV